MLDRMKLHSIMPLAGSRVDLFIDSLNAAMDEFGISTKERAAAFLAQVAHESAQLTHLVENLNYSDPKRIAQIFRKATDLDRDGVIDHEEIEFARQFVRQPQKLANLVYANRMGNGDAASGDGWKFIARGPIGITGKNNYRACSEALFADPNFLLIHPEALEKPEAGSRAAGWFWQLNGLNDLADAGKFRTITQRINGGLNGIQEREAYHARATAALA